MFFPSPFDQHFAATAQQKVSGAKITFEDFSEDLRRPRGLGRHHEHAAVRAQRGKHIAQFPKWCMRCITRAKHIWWILHLIRHFTQTGCIHIWFYILNHRAPKAVIHSILTFAEKSKHTEVVAPQPNQTEVERQDDRVVFHQWFSINSHIIHFLPISIKEHQPFNWW